VKGAVCQYAQLSDRGAIVSYCTNCGTQEQEGQRFCPVCGAQKYGAVPAAPMPPLTYGSASGEAMVRVGLSMAPPRQSRWSVFFRGLLALPLFIVAEFVGIAAVFVTIVAWFSALFSGRVPDGMQRFLTNALRLFANLLAYYYLLVPRWPGLNFHTRPTEQVSLEIDHVGLNRAAVFFRIILGYPANIVSIAFTLGAVPILFVMWCWGVIVGREPRALHQAMALVLRFQLRLQAYVGLVTPTQPFRSSFGDGAAGATDEATTVEGATLPTRWYVKQAAKVTLVVMLVIGGPLYALNFFIERPLLTRFQTYITRDIVSSSYDTTVNATAQFETSVARCTAASTYTGCAQRAATTAVNQLAPVTTAIASNAFAPPDAVQAMTTYRIDFEALKLELSVIQNSTSASTQRSEVAQIPASLDAFHSAYVELWAILHNGAANVRQT
jgi:hypothetical protein